MSKNNVITINCTIRSESRSNAIAGGLARVVSGTNSFDWICGDANGTLYNVVQNESSWKTKETPDLPIEYLAASPTEGKIVISSEEKLNLLSYPNLNVIDSEFLKLSLKVSQISYSKDGQHIFVSSGSRELFIYSLVKRSVVCKINLSEEVGIKAFQLSQNDNFISIFDMSGNLTIFSLSKGEDIESNYISYNPTYEQEYRSKSGDLTLMRDVSLLGFKGAWSPFRDRFLLPQNQGSITILRRDPENTDDKWTDSFLSSSDGPDPEGHSDTSTIYLLQFSPNGKYLASVDDERRIVIWKVNEEKIENSIVMKKIIFTIEGSDDKFLVDLQWGREENDNYLILLSKEKSIQINDIVDNDSIGTLLPAKMYTTNEIAQLIDNKKDELELEASQSQMNTNTDKSLKRLSKAKVSFQTDDKNDDDNVFESTTTEVDATNISAIKGLSSKNRVIDDGDDNQLDDEDDHENDEMIIDDSQFFPNYSMPSAVTLQPAFQPSSTVPDEKKRRFLVWNCVGNITSREDSIDRRIEIRFTNTMGNNRGEGFSDTYNFKMASLSYEGAVFATEMDPNANRESNFQNDPPGSVIYYHAFPNQRQLDGANESFRSSLPDGEGALAVAVGKGWVAVATSKGFLRLYSSTGIQLSIVALKGPVVCLCGYMDHLAVIYHGTPINESFNMMVDIFHLSSMDGIKGQAVVTDRKVPLSKGSRLVWAAFEVDSNLLTIVDSEGLVSVFLNYLGWQWIPVLDIAKVRKTIDHVYWPVMVKGHKFVYVLLNGESKPAVHPLPIVTVKPFKFPLAKVSDEKETEHSHFLIWQHAKASHYEALKTDLDVFRQGSQSLNEETEEILRATQLDIDKTVLTMMQDALKAQKVSTALNLALKLRGENSIRAGIVIANHFGRSALANLLENVLDTRIQVEQQMIEESQQDHNNGGYNNNDDNVNEKYTEQQNDNYNSYEQFDDDYENQSNPTGTTLSSKVNSVRNAQNNFFSKKNLNDSKVVSPFVNLDNTNDNMKSIPKVVNPFAIRQSDTTPLKRKNVLAAVQDLKASPSPAKKPALNRQSTFAQAARMQKLTDKRIL